MCLLSFLACLSLHRLVLPSLLSFLPTQRTGHPCRPGSNPFPVILSSYHSSRNLPPPRFPSFIINIVFVGHYCPYPPAMLRLTHPRKERANIVYRKYFEVVFTDGDTEGSLTPLRPQTHPLNSYMGQFSDRKPEMSWVTLIHRRTRIYPQQNKYERLRHTLAISCIHGVKGLHPIPRPQDYTANREAVTKGHSIHLGCHPRTSAQGAG